MTSTPRGELLTIPEAANALSLKVATLRAWVLRRKIGYVRIGTRSIRVPLSEVKKVISAGTIPAKETANGR